MERPFTGGMGLSSPSALDEAFKQAMQNVQ
jgi:hypothetical protein